MNLGLICVDKKLCQKSDISPQLGDMFRNQGGICNQGGVTESSCVCTQYSDFKVLK